jgi:hypothetical protein
LISASIGEFGQHPVGHRRRIEVGCRCRRFRAAGRGRSVTNRVEQAKPELLGVLLAALHLQDGEPTRLPGRSVQARSSDVFPLPAGAEMIVTFRVAARSRAARSSPRSINRGAA